MTKVADCVLAAVQKGIINGTVCQLLPFHLEDGLVANRCQVLACLLKTLQNLVEFIKLAVRQNNCDNSIYLSATSKNIGTVEFDVPTTGCFQFRVKINILVLLQQLRFQLLSAVSANDVLLILESGVAHDFTQARNHVKSTEEKKLRFCLNLSKCVLLG